MASSSVSKLTFDEACLVYRAMLRSPPPPLETSRQLSPKEQRFFDEKVSFHHAPSIFIECIYDVTLHLPLGPLSRARLCDRDYVNYALKGWAMEDERSIWYRIRRTIDKRFWRNSPEEHLAVPRGLEMEERLLHSYAKMTNLTLKRCGFIARQDYAIAACRPDALIFRNGNFIGAVEVKCWQLDEPPSDFVQNPMNLNNGHLGRRPPIKLKNCYLQMQLAMAILGLRSMVLIVGWWKNEGEFAVVKIKRNNRVINQMTNFFNQFYFDKFLPVASTLYYRQ